jgi:hypothetical protein
MRVQPTSMKALCTFLPSAGIAGGCLSCSSYFISSWAANLFHFDSHNTPAMIPWQPPTQTTDQASYAWSTSSTGHQHRLLSVTWARLLLPYPTVLLVSTSKKLPTSNSSAGAADVRWNSTSANDGRSGLSGEASDVGLPSTS